LSQLLLTYIITKSLETIHRLDVLKSFASNKAERFFLESEILISCPAERPICFAHSLLLFIMMFVKLIVTISQLITKVISHRENLDSVVRTEPKI